MPVLVALFPFSVLFGAVAMERGLSFVEVILASMSIYAVASQYLMLDLMAQQIPVWMIVLSVFALNFRHVLYSAAIGRKLDNFSALQKALAFFLLVDPQYAASEGRAIRKALTPAWYFSYAATVYGIWIVANCIGASFGALMDIPASLGLDFILPLFFTALIMGFRSTSQFWMIALVSAGISILAYITVGSPWHISIGGLAGLLIAVLLAKPKAQNHA